MMEVKFIPKPRPITETCKRYLVMIFVSPLKGLVNVKPIKRPIAREVPAEKENKMMQATAAINKVLAIRILFSFILSEMYHYLEIFYAEFFFINSF